MAIRETATPTGISNELKALRKELMFGKLKNKAKKETKPWKIPFKTKMLLNKSKKQGSNSIVVAYLSKDYKLDFKLVPVDSSNIVVVNSRAYEFDPRAIWRLGKKWNVYLIREIDRRPISNRDYDDVRVRGDSTDSDEILLKAAMKAITLGTTKTKKNIGIIVVIAIIAIVLFLVFGGGLGGAA